MGTRKTIFAALIAICSVIIVFSFFMPWAKANVNVTKVAQGLSGQADTTLKSTPFAGRFVSGFDKTTKAIGNLGDLEVKTAVSGYDIPTMINKKSSKIALSLAQIMFKDAKDLDKKSLAVYLLPLLAIFCIVLAIMGLAKTVPVIAMAVISGVISLAGLYNLMTMNVSSLTIQVTIEKGLWQTMYSYLIIFVLSIAWIAMDFIKPKKS